MATIDDLRITFRPLDRWPGERTAHPERSRFSARWGDTLELLKRELNMLDARNVVLMLDMDESQFRRDGYPRAGAIARSQGVVLAFESRYGPLKYACDAFTHWSDNLRAIALGLESLRRVDRFKITTKRGEQYTGWKPLPEPGRMTPQQAAEILASYARGEFEPRELLTYIGHLYTAYRRAAMATHPDHGGSAEEFQRVQEAKRVLEEYHAARR